MIKSPSCLLLVIFVLLFSGNLFSQEKLPLKAVFAAIEKQHHVKFNYTEETVSPIMAGNPEASLSLQQKLEQIQQQLPLGFEITDNYYIIVSAAPNATETKTNMTAFDLNEVAINNYLTSGISKKKNGNFVIKPQKFGILPGLTETDILQTMQQIPGIYSADESISNINVRGGTHDQNLFLWNGIRMFQTGHFFGLISAFNPALPNKITIAKNGSSAFYGESVSSVVDISTVPENQQESEFGFGANLISADIYAKIKASEKASFVVSARRSYTDAVNSPTYQKYYNRIFQNTIVMNIDNNQVIDYKTDEKFYFYDFTLQYEQKIGKKHELVVDGIGISNQLGIHQHAFINTLFESKYSFLEQQSYGGNISWKTNWNTNNYTKINAYASWYNLNGTNESIEKNQLLHQQNSVFDTGLRIEDHHQLTSQLAFNDGYQYNETGNTNFDEINDPEYRRNIKQVLRIHVLVLETDYHSLSNATLLRTGLRINYFEKFDKFLFEPRLQFNQAVTAQLNLEVLGEMKSQTASQIIDLQQDFLGIEKRRWTLANNEDVPIQQSAQLAVGLTFKDRQWLCTVDNFYKQVNGISSPGQAFQNQLETVKLNGDYTVTGSEILIQHNFRKFYTWLGYSFNHNEYRFHDFDPSRFPNNFEIEHSITGAVIYDWKKLKIALGGKWNSGRPTTSPQKLANGQITYNAPNDRTLADFLQFNLSTAYGWNLGAKTRFEISASVMNLFNRRNTINRYYRVNTLNNSIESVNTYALERTPNLSVRFNY